MVGAIIPPEDDEANAAKTADAANAAKAAEGNKAAKATDEDISFWKNQFRLLQNALESANEDGLLKDDTANYQAIMENILGGVADLSLPTPNTIEARKKYGLASQKFNQYVNSTTFWWRFKYCYEGPALIYLLSVLVIILAAWLFFSSSLSDSTLLWVPSWAFLWGAIGGIFNGFWWLWQHATLREVRKPWYIWYAVLPIMGAILGALVYLIYIAGFITATGETDLKSNFFAMLLSALAGFSAKWAVDLLNKVTDIIQIKGK
jgi:hypothetical protein